MQGGCVVLFGGVVDANGNTRSSDAYRLWLEPPPLQWTALRLLLKTYPHLLSR